MTPIPVCLAFLALGMITSPLLAQLHVAWDNRRSRSEARTAARLRYFAAIRATTAPATPPPVDAELVTDERPIGDTLPILLAASHRALDPARRLPSTAERYQALRALASPGPRHALPSGGPR